MEKVEKHYEETIPKYHAEIYELRDRLSLLESQAVEREKTNQMLTTELVKQEDRLAKLEQLHEAVKAYHEYVDRYVFQNEGDSVTLGELKMELRLALAALEDT